MISPIRVRPAKKADTRAVERVLLASYPSLMARAYKPEVLALALPIMTRPNPRLLGSGTYYVAEQNGEIIGCGGWSREEPGGDVIAPGSAHVRHFAVSPEFVGRGAGRAMFNQCEIDARVHGISLFKCFASLNAVGFYKLLGFEERGIINVALGQGISLPSMLMERRL